MYLTGCYYFIREIFVKNNCVIRIMKCFLEQFSMYPYSRNKIARVFYGNANILYRIYKQFQSKKFGMKFFKKNCK